MVGVPMDANTRANEDDALKQINVKPRRFDGCDFLNEEQTSEVHVYLQKQMAFVEPLRGSLMHGCLFQRLNFPIDPLAWWKMHDGQFPQSQSLPESTCT